MPYGNYSGYLKDSGGTTLDTVAKAATFDSEWVDIGAGEVFGFIVETASTSGTTPTLDIDVEATFDGGTTVFDYPAFLNVEAGDSAEAGIASAGIADFAQITADGVTAKFFPSFFPNATSGGLNLKVRLECTIGGTNPSFTLTIVKLVKNTSQIV